MNQGMIFNIMNDKTDDEKIDAEKNTHKPRSWLERMSTLLGREPRDRAPLVDRRGPRGHGVPAGHGMDPVLRGEQPGSP